MAIQRINLGTAPSGTGGDTNRSAFTKIDGNFADSANAASRQVGTSWNNVMQVGAFGLGATTQADNPTTDPHLIAGGFFKLPSSSPALPPSQGSLDNYGIAIPRHQPGFGGLLFLPYYTGSSNQVCYRAYGGSKDSYSDFVFKTNRNTSVDANGFIKNASPIVKLFADKIELNAEAELQPITFEKLGVGDYLIKGSLGFAQEGWYIEMPKDANGNVLVAVIYEQLDNNDISVKTYAKKFDEETGDVVANTAKPRDIPATRWIDLRLQELPQDDVQPLDTDETVNTNAE